MNLFVAAASDKLILSFFLLVVKYNNNFKFSPQEHNHKRYLIEGCRSIKAGQNVINIFIKDELEINSKICLTRLPIQVLAVIVIH